MVWPSLHLALWALSSFDSLRLYLPVLYLYAICACLKWIRNVACRKLIKRGCKSICKGPKIMQSRYDAIIKYNMSHVTHKYTKQGQADNEHS